MRRKNRNYLDEMQEQKLLRIEHNGCWLAFWGLLAALLVQLIFCGDQGWRYMAGEWIVFICLALYLVAGSLKQGIWDRCLEPSPKANLRLSLMAGGIAGVVFFIVKYVQFGTLFGALASGVVIFAIVLAATYIALAFCLSIYRRRFERLEEEHSDSEVRRESGR